MQTLDKFNDNLGTAIALVGGAGSGKTALGLSLFPRTYAFVADLNFKSGIDHLKRRNILANVVGFDQASPDENGNVVVPNLRYDRMLRCLTEATKSPDIDAIFVDSGTFIEQIIKAKICGATNEATIKLDGFAQWGAYAMTWQSIIMQLRQSGKKLLMAFHENKEKDESDQIFKYKIAVDGSFSGKIPAYFSDVWRCEVVEQGAGPSAKHVWQVRTLSNLRQEHLKNTYALPAVLPADELVTKIRATLPK